MSDGMNEDAQPIHRRSYHKLEEAIAALGAADSLGVDCTLERKTMYQKRADGLYPVPVFVLTLRPPPPRPEK